jgi:hypothetical protein
VGLFRSWPTTERLRGRDKTDIATRRRCKRVGWGPTPEQYAGYLSRSLTRLRGYLSLLAAAHEGRQSVEGSAREQFNFAEVDSGGRHVAQYLGFDFDGLALSRTEGRGTRQTPPASGFGQRVETCLAAQRGGPIVGAAAKHRRGWTSHRYPPILSEMRIPAGQMCGVRYGAGREGKPARVYMHTRGGWPTLFSLYARPGSVAGPENYRAFPYMLAPDFPGVAEQAYSRFGGSKRRGHTWSAWPAVTIPPVFPPKFRGIVIADAIRIWARCSKPRRPRLFRRPRQRRPLSPLPDTPGALNITHRGV